MKWIGRFKKKEDFRIWKKEGDKEEYLVAKCMARKEVYKAKKISAGFTF